VWHKDLRPESQSLVVELRASYVRTFTPSRTKG
jgi:hypothetical protein